MLTILLWYHGNKIGSHQLKSATHHKTPSHTKRQKQHTNATQNNTGAKLWTPTSNKIEETATTLKATNTRGEGRTTGKQTRQEQTPNGKRNHTETETNGVQTTDDWPTITKLVTIIFTPHKKCHIPSA